MNTTTKRWPAEWEPQDAVLLAWPHKDTDWSPVLPEARTTFSEIISAIERFQRIILIRPDAYDIPCNDTWARDFGPITIEENSRPALLDFTFNGWGAKFPAELDNTTTRRLHELGAFGQTTLRTVDLILEGGSIESDGEGTLLTTTECLLNPNRNPNLTQEQIEQQLKNELGVQTILWLKNGALAGDDTDAHIDNPCPPLSKQNHCLCRLR